MAFNPLNLQLQRETAGIKRRHSYVQLKLTTIFGRSSISDVKLFGRKCSKKQCTIEFRDGTPFITDFSTNGTFVNNVRVEEETALSENDKISFGIHPDFADIHSQDTYIFNVVRQEVVELDDSDDEDVQIVEIDSGNESGSVEEVQRLPDENAADQNDDEKAGEEEDEAVEEDKSDEKAPENSKEPCTSQSVITGPPLSKVQQLKEKQESLRHWNVSKVPVIDPLPLKTGRQRKEPEQPVAGPSTGKRKNQKQPAVQGAPKKRGRPPKELKERLAAIVPPVQEKPKDPKPARDLKIKITKNNRGAFLCTDLQKNQNAEDTSEDTE